MGTLVGTKELKYKNLDEFKYLKKMGVMSKCVLISNTVF